MLFGEFLLEKGLVAEDALINGLNRQHDSKKPLGQLAVQKGFIDSKGLFKVLTEQRRKNREANDFGSIALEMGFLNQQQVDELVEFQNTTRELLGNILVEGGILTREKLVQALREFNLKSTK